MSAPPAPLAPDTPDAAAREAPLSFAQQRLWFLDRLLPGSPVYNMPMAYRLRGPLDPGRLAACLREVVRRHEILRTRFADGGDAPLQRVAPPGSVPLPRLDLGAIPLPARHAEERRLLAAEALRPFDLERGPLLRALLLRLSDGEWVVLLAMHHIISDGWSMGVMLRELAVLYEALAAGLPSPLAELPVQYADFALWQRERLQGKRLARQLGFWRTHLAGPPAALALPADRPRPAVQTYRGAAEPLSLSPAAETGLRRLAGWEGASLFMVTLAGFLALLHLHTGQTDLVVGTPWAARARVELEGLIGFFVNTLPVRVDLSGEPGFRELVGRVKLAAMGAYANGEVPFERLVEEVAAERDLSRSPLFQATFILHAATLTNLPRLGGLELEPLSLSIEASKFDLVATLEEQDGELKGALRYNPDLFDATTLRRMARHLEALYAAAADDPRRPVSALSTLSAAERQALLVEWSDTAVPSCDGPWAHQLFRAHALRHPESVALIQGKRILTYGELDRRSDRLACALRALGVGPEVPVAICAERSIERVVGVVAVLKAGGAFVSLDPAYPSERLEYMLLEARVPVVLAEASTLDRLPPTAARVIRLDRDLGLLGGDESRPPAVDLHPDNLAYLVYTSGSTGRPKAIATPHRGLLNLVLWFVERYGLTAADRGSLVASPAFDLSIAELWPFLAAGASLAIADEETRLSAEGTLRWWADAGITVAFLPTPLGEAVLESDIPLGLDLRLRELLVGGDRLRRPPAPGTPFEVSNCYGPAEYSVASTEGIVPALSREASFNAPSIGRPLAGTRAYVLGGEGQVVPAGASGELFLGGVGLSRGYLRRPDLTAERFVPDPFAGPREETGARLYRTGDLVRWLGDGKLDFLGRADRQVKLRGMRVELGEIEKVLSRHPRIRAAVVLARPEKVGGVRIVAYAVPAGTTPELYEFRENLRSILPEYMVPSAFLWLEALPLTPNGKVDRKALASLAEPQAESGEGFAPPSTPLEVLVAEIWSEVLDRERVGLYDSFWDLGGHSLLATRVLARLNRTLGVELPLQTLFKSPTVAGLILAIGEDVLAE